MGRNMDISGIGVLYHKGVMMSSHSHKAELYLLRYKYTLTKRCVLLSTHSIETHLPYSLACERSRSDTQLCLWEVKLLSILWCW